MATLTQRKQLGLKIQNVDGTPETITASEIVTVLEPKANINLNNVRPPVQRGSFSKVPSGTGIQDGGVTYRQQFAGPADGLAATPSPLDLSLRPAGFRRVDLYAVRIATMVAGPRFVVGDELVTDVTGARVRVMATVTRASINNSETHADILLYELLSTGTNIGPTDTGAAADNTSLSTPTESHAGGAPALTFSSQTGTRVGTAWVPTSQITKTIQISSTSGTFQVGEDIFQPIDNVSAGSAFQIAYGRIVAVSSSEIEFVQYDGYPFQNSGLGQVAGVTSAATADVDSDGISTKTPPLTAAVFEDGRIKNFSDLRASTVITLPTGDFPTLDVTLQGRYDSAVSGANFNTGGAARGATPTFLGTDIRIDRTYTPCAQQFQINVGQNLVRDTCSNNASGLEGFLVTDRTPTFTMDPKTVAEIISQSYTDAKAANIFPVQWRWGNYLTGTGVDAWLMSADVCQYESLNDGDRDGIITDDATVQINGYETLNDYEMSLCNYSRTLVDAL